MLVPGLHCQRVLGAAFSRHRHPRLLDQRRIERGRKTDRLRENRGCAVAGDAVQGLVPDVVGGDIQARNGARVVVELRELFCQRHAPQKIVDAPVHRLRGIGVDGRTGCRHQQQRRQKQTRASRGVAGHDHPCPLGVRVSTCSAGR